MRTTKALLAAALAIAAVLTSVAPGGAPMGPPTTTLEEGQWSFGGQFGLEEMDMEAYGKVAEDFTPYFWTQRFTVEDYKTKMLFGTLEYGLCDNWGIFARFGGADGKATSWLPPPIAAPSR